MATKLLEVQQKIFAALDSNQELKGIITGVYDYVPEDVLVPYITFGQMLSSDDGTKTDKGEKLDIYIEIWSENKGRKEAITILTLAEQCLEPVFTLNSAVVIEQKVINREVVEETYGVYHATLEIQIRLVWNE